MTKHNVIIEDLKKHIKSTENNKSSFWKKHLNQFTNYLNPYAFVGAVSYTKKNLANKPLNFLLSRIVYGNKIFFSKTYKSFKKIFDSIDRQIDNAAIRHIFTFELLKNKVNPSKICIIGDGKINGLIGSVAEFPLAKIYSVNLTEVLINDYLILEKTNLVEENLVQVVNSINDEDIENKKIVFVPANLKNFLNDKKIDLFINITAFQEMTIGEINDYFDIIKLNKSFLYCCNKEFKKLYDGEELYFDKYPWGYGKKLLFENCPWVQKFYFLKYPFISNYNGKIKHCLIDYSKK